MLVARRRELFPLYHPAAAMYNQTLRATLFDDARALGRRAAGVGSPRDAAGLLLVIAGAARGSRPPAAAQVPAKPQTASLDSEAPPGSPPHWLPNERWVMQHWLPLRRGAPVLAAAASRRGDVWRWLRDDTRNLAGLARAARLGARGAGARARRAVARASCASRRGWRCSSRARCATLTQGHLSQHIFFHSLHQNAIPDAAPEIFGTQHDAVPLPAPLRALAADDLPAQRALARARAGAAEQTLRAMVARGVRGPGDPGVAGRAAARAPAAPGPALAAADALQRPAAAQAPRGSIATASNYSNNAALSRRRAARCVWEGYEAKLAIAKARGEIGVVAPAAGGLPRRSAADPAAARQRRARPTTRRCRPTGAGSRSSPPRATSTSPSATAQMRRLRARPARPGARRAARDRLRRRDRHSAYNPSLSADGRRRRVRDLGVRARRARRAG